MIEDVRADGGGGGAGGGGVILASAPAAPLIGSNQPTQRFDISVLSGLKDSDKYLGKNRVSDIKQAYQTYLTGNPVGRGGQYAVDSAKKYGTTIVEAARGYLVGVGLPTLADILPTNTTTTTGGGGGGNGDSTQNTTTTDTDPVKILADEIRSLFGAAIQSAPLQSQAYGYTPVSGNFGGAAGGGSSGLGLWLILGAVGIIAFFIYRRFAS